MRDIKVGDRVAYSAQFLRSTGQISGDIPFARGVVRSIEQLGECVSLAHVAWNTDAAPEKVNVKNLAIVGPNRRFCNVD